MPDLYDRMLNWKQLALFTFAASLWSVAAGAQSYDVSVTRKDRNVYKVDGKQLLVRTKYCYVYAYSEEAVLRMRGRTGDLIFIDSRDKCDVEAVYSGSDQQAGKYSVTVSCDDDDWYSVMGGALFIKTSMCLNLALGEEAFLSLGLGGVGRLVFETGDSCTVEGLYQRMKLD